MHIYDTVSIKKIFFPDLSSSDEYSDSPTSPCNSQPWLGQASVAWAHHSKEPPLQWDTDPIPAFPRFLRTDVACRLALSHIQGLVVRRCKLSQCHGGISVGRRGQARVEQCDMMDLQYGVRCLQNTKVSVIIQQSLRADSRFAPSQWETPLLCNDVSHWLGTNLESTLVTHTTDTT